MIHSHKKLTNSEKECKKCVLHKKCYFSNNIGGRGAAHPTWLFVGQNPGKDEDKYGKAFVGKSGQLLIGLIKDIGFPKGTIRLTNAVRCWSGDRNPPPENDDITACRPYLLEEIKRVKPKVVVILGGVALKAVTGKSSIGITRMRGTVWEEDGILYIPAFHPAALMRDKNKLESFIHDLKLAFEIAETGIPEAKGFDHTLVASYDEGMDWIKWLEEEEQSLCTDYETQGSKKTSRGYKADPFADDACCLSVAYCWEPGKSVGIPLLHRDAPFSKEKGMSLIARISLMNRRRNRAGLKSEAYQAVFDLMFPYVTHNVSLFELDFDPYLAHHLLNEELKMPGLSQLTWNYTDMGGYDKPLEEYIKNHPECDVKKGGSYGNIPYYDFLGPYNCGDTDASKRLRIVLEPKLEEQDLTYVYQKITLPATYPVVDYHVNGICIDKKLASNLSAKWRLRMQELTDLCRQHTDVVLLEQLEVVDKQKKWKIEEKQRLREGKRTRNMPDYEHTFNPGSDKDCRRVWFEIARLDVQGLTDKKQPKVDKATRLALWDEHDIVKWVHEYKSLSKFGGTYVEKLLNQSDSKGIYRGFYDLTGTVTGRMTSDLQQLPRGTTNEDVKRCVISRFGDEGGVAEIDVSQGEVRVWAIASRDKSLRKAFSEGKDVHTWSASLAFDVPYDEVSDELRSNTKAIVTFGLMYRRRANALASDMGWTVEEAQKFIDKYFRIFKGVWEKGEYYASFAKQNGYLLNMFRRRRRLPDAQSSQDYIRERALRQGINFPIQSTLHDIMMYAEYEIWKAFKKNKLKSKLCGETHDGIIVDYLKDELSTITHIAKTVFENLPFEWIDIPMVIDIEVGPNLLDLKKIKF